MGGKHCAKTVVILLIAQASHFSAAIFFHELSSVLIKPYGNGNYITDFGFAMGFQTKAKNLVVGAPTEDNIGKVYICGMEDARSVTQIDCNKTFIDVESIAYSRKINSCQYFYTGASIAATSNYFFTCSPLLTMDKKQGILEPDAFGTCFVKNDTDSYRYIGTLERYLKHPLKIRNFNSFLGGTGWSTLIDEENDLLLIAKGSLFGDFTFTSMSNPLQETKSLVLDGAFRRSKKYLNKKNNVGHGLAAGKFFSKQKTSYAFSLETYEMRGVIAFLEYDLNINVLSMMLDKRNKTYEIEETQAIGTMFGTTMGAADLNMDGMDELLVAAPAQSDGDCVECGALHIYLGGDVSTIREPNRLRTILGSSYLGRLGTAIAARDLDGDSIPEVVVSAPYEDSGLGSVYILSGYELFQTLCKDQSTKSILSIQDLKLTQRIQKENFRTLGFSLQFIHDVDWNGCSELAVGAPGSGRVLLYKCVQKVNVTVSTELIGEQIVREQDTNFTVKVCARVELHDLTENIIGNISIVSSIIHDATYIPEPKFDIDIACFRCSKDRKFCKNVTVILNNNERSYYTFTSKAELHIDHILKDKEFNSTWVAASPYKLESKLEVSRYCKGDDCIPKLSVAEILWSGSKEYVLGSSLNETVTIRVRNDGNASYDSCVWLRVSGVPHVQVGCASDNGGSKPSIGNQWLNQFAFICDLIKPLRRNAEVSVKLILYMTMPTNLVKELLVDVVVLENCNKKTNISGNLQIPYVLTTDNIYTAGISHNRNLTEKQIMDNDLFVEQEYIITNNGSVTWENVTVLISMEEKPFIDSSEVSAMDSSECEENKTAGEIVYKCILDLKPNSNQTIVITTKIFAYTLTNTENDKKLNITSQLKLYLQPTDKIKYANVTTVMRFEQEASFANNKLLIGLLALFLAIIILAILIFVLYKYGFFRRKQKQRLHVLRESRRQNSVRLSSLRHHTHTSDAVDGHSGQEHVEGLQMDVDDDCPFDMPQPITSDDSAVLVEEKVQVHC